MGSWLHFWVSTFRRVFSAQRNPSHAAPESAAPPTGIYRPNEPKSILELVRPVPTRPSYIQGVQLVKGTWVARKETTQIVLHESVTRTRARCIRVLKGRKLSVHFTVDRYGGIAQHAPIEARCAHAKGHNAMSIAVEVINRYYGAKAHDSEIVIDAEWAHKGKYILPTPIQMEAVWKLVDWLCYEQGVLMQFPGQVEGGFHWGPNKRGWKPGVVAHHRTAHADALTAECYCFLRAIGHSRRDAYGKMVEMASAKMGRDRFTPLS